jgi:UDP-3-O-[3-hydroxymyristoyl] glucosamine N-acyltransferase
MRLGELVEQLGGRLAQGREELGVTGVNSSENASETEIVFAEDAPSAMQSLASHAAVVVLKPNCIDSYVSNSDIAVIEARQPRLWFARAAKLLAPVEQVTGVHPTALLGTNVKLGACVWIGPNAVLGENAEIGAGTRIDAGAVIGAGVRIGENCRIYPRVVLYSGTTLGNGVIIHGGAVLGADGFGYVRDNETGAYTQFPQRGTLAIEDDVEIGANSTIDRGALAETRIRRGVKIDNLVHIGHNCEIGEDVIIVSGTGISGSCTVGKGAILAGQVGMGDHSHVGAGVIMGGQAGVLPHKTVTNEGQKPGSVMWGTPARPLMQVLREQATLTRLTKSGRGKNNQQGEE